MHKLIVLYTQPADEAAFLKHYREVHTPLVLQLPGVAQLEVTRLTGDPGGGEGAYFLMAETTFPDQATYQAAMRSPQHAAVVEDLDSFAQGLVTLLEGTDLTTDESPPPRPNHVPDPVHIMDKQREMDQQGKTASGAYEIMDDKQ